MSLSLNERYPPSSSTPLIYCWTELLNSTGPNLFANAFHDWNIDSVIKLLANSFKSLTLGGLIAIF